MSKPGLPFWSLVVAVLSMLFTMGNSTFYNQEGGAQVQLLDLDGRNTARLTDGDRVQLEIQLPENASQALPVQFRLDSSDDVVGTCEVPAGSRQCQTSPISAYGWYWEAGGAPRGSLRLQALAADGPLATSQDISIAPRPVVMVHGFSSNAAAWQAYLGQGGFLAQHGIPAYAVGDGQVEGALNTGRLDNPFARTNTIAENATILGQYIAGVKKATGAQQVDLLAHSMGGLISRYYIGKVMEDRDVAQLIMLGSPMAGTACANLPASLGYYLPAVLELRPDYVRQIFNPQVSDRRGITFHALAGTPVQQPFQSPCTDVPTDLAVSLSSVTSIPLDAGQMPVLHTSLNTSPEVFQQYVLPLLAQPVPNWQDEPPLDQAVAQPEALQFSQVYSGHIDAGGSQELVIPIDPGVTVASFALYDASRSLDVQVRGASGNEIVLDPEKNGLVVIDDPASLIYLGYGFQDPKPGEWKITLKSTARTPAGGSDYALTARYQGGAQLQASLGSLIAQLDQPLQITARLQLDGQALPVESAVALIRSPDGSEDQVELVQQGDVYQAEWTPALEGLHGVQLQVTGQTVDGARLNRGASLAFEVQKDEGPSLLILLVLGTVCFAGVALSALLAATALSRSRARTARKVRQEY